MRTIGVVTAARSDYGIYLPVLRKIQECPDLSLKLMVTGMHLSPEFGSTVRTVEDDGFDIVARVETLMSSDSPEGISKAMGLGAIGFGQAFAGFRPDILLVLGDRFEMHAAVVASLPFNIPVAHIHGGESTEGLIDEPIRHSITKMSHLHFVSTETYGQRVIQMGEEPWRVTVTGAPALDHLGQLPFLSLECLNQVHGFDLAAPTLLVTYHPVTLGYQDTNTHVENLLGALDATELNLIFTYPNADTNSRSIIEMVRNFAEDRPKCRVAVSLGTQVYFSLMNNVTAMVGNSSSGIIEAASFHLPVVNIGDRQRGRLHGNNVIDVGNGRDEIAGGIEKARSAGFRAQISKETNPYGDGHAAERIVDTLKSVTIDQDLLLKRFHQLSKVDAEPVLRHG